MENYRRKDMLKHATLKCFVHTDFPIIKNSAQYMTLFKVMTLFKTIPCHFKFQKHFVQGSLVLSKA